MEIEIQSLYIIPLIMNIFAFASRAFTKIELMYHAGNIRIISAVLNSSNHDIIDTI